MFVPTKRVAVIGGGVVGLACAREILLNHARRSQQAIAPSCFLDVLLLEAAASFGTATSSRNSGVLHAGIYYPTNSNKHKFCIHGYQKILRFCDKFRVPYQLCGKLIVDTDNLLGGSAAGSTKLDEIYRQGLDNGVPKLELIEDRGTILQLEPNLADSEIARAIYSPLTGIVDVHQYLLALLTSCEEQACAEQAEGRGGNGGRSSFDVVYNCEVLGARRSTITSKMNTSAGVDHGEKTTLQTSQGDLEDVDVVVNCAGLHACRVAERVLGGSSVEIPPPVYAKGNYWKLERRAGGYGGASADGSGSGPSGSTSSRGSWRHLIYPLPEPGGLGTHLTLDLDGQIRFGPNVEFLDLGLDDRESAAATATTEEQHAQQSFETLEQRLNAFYQTVSPPTSAVYESIKRYYPKIEDDGVLVGDYVGIRPKLQGETDFKILSDTSGRSIHCLGIESPGLTSSLAIGEHVAKQVLSLLPTG
eukprot:g12521.t1